MSNELKVFRQKDHIILPKSTLKRFANPVTKKIACLDLSEPERLIIKEVYPKAFHTQANFYFPEYDNIIKKYETKIGKYNKLVADNTKNHLDIDIQAQELKADILSIINIQFQRSIIADDGQLAKLKNQFGEQHNQESLFYFRNGIYSRDFMKKKEEFNQASQNIDTFRYYAQSIIGQKNPIILETYKDFVPIILVIPNEVTSTFILSPQHFVANETFARIVISPRISLALYPKSITTNNMLIKSLSPEEVDSLVPRTIESALSMTNNFRQIIGEEKYLTYIKDKLQMYKSLISNFTDSILLINGNTAALCNQQDFHELIVSIQLFKPNYHNLIITLNVISTSFLQEQGFLDSIKMLERFEFTTIFVCNSSLKCPIADVKVASNYEEASKLF